MAGGLASGRETAAAHTGAVRPVGRGGRGSGGAQGRGMRHGGSGAQRKHVWLATRALPCAASIATSVATSVAVSVAVSVAISVAAYITASIAVSIAA